ncbi:hypothetical protein GQX74_000512 [Glossina fuscipes]|nr:hypothetical protein GQX74_000512 [Glossina fuscipes]
MIITSDKFNVYKICYGLEYMLASDCLLSDLEEVIVVMRKEKEENSGNGAGAILPHIHTHHDGYRTRELGAFEHGLLDGDMFLQLSDAKVYKVYKKLFNLIRACDNLLLRATFVTS